MLLDYLQAALRQAKYRILEDGAFYGEIPGFAGLWASAPTLEACREELQSSLEDWLLVSLRLNHRLPVVEGLDLNAKPQPEQVA